MSGRSLATCLLILILAGAIASVADPARPEQPDPARFRIVFPSSSAEPVAEGKIGGENRAAIANIARALINHSGWPSLRFIFVSPRPVPCALANKCAPEHLMWQRVNAATSEIKAEVDKAGTPLPFGQLGWAFVDELQRAPELALLPEGSEAISLFLLVEDDGQAEACAGQVLVFDPSLPPVIGAPWGAPAIPLPADRIVEAAAGTTVQMSQSSDEPRFAHAFWEREDGSCHPDEPLASGQPVEVELAKQTLHLIVARSSTALAEIHHGNTEQGCKTVAALSENTSRSKGIGDNVQPLDSGTLIARPEPETVLLACSFTFVPADPRN